MAKYHEMGRFNKDVLDTAASLFHEQQAADLGIKEAILTLANLYLGIQQDVLTNVVIEVSHNSGCPRTWKVSKLFKYLLFD